MQVDGGAADPDYDEWQELERIAAEVGESMRAISPRLAELRQAFSRRIVSKGDGRFTYRGTTFRVVDGVTG